MKAMVFTKYGSPDVLSLQDVDIPVPSENDVLVKIKAASINPYDWHFLRGSPYVFRLQAGLFKPKIQILGYDVAGIVEEVGSSVTRFKAGDEVYGASINSGFAEYSLVKEDNLIKKPENITFEEAASLPMVVFTALQGLQDKAGIKAGQKVLVNGASGGVGSMAVQIAKIFIAEVTGVCSGKNIELVKSLGADFVIDYTKEDFSRSSKKYDIVYDSVGNRSFNDLKNSLAENGHCVNIGFKSFGLLIQIMLRGSSIGSKKIELMVATEKQSDLEFANKHILEGKIKAVIDKTYPFEELPEAIAYVEEGHTRGKVVITI